MVLRPLQNRIILEPDVVKTQTESGIYLREDDVLAVIS